MQATYNEQNRIAYVFAQWSDDNTNSTRTVEMTVHRSLIAEYTPKPLPPEYVFAGGTVGDYVHLTWNAHPSQYVTQFQIWRIVKPKNQSQQNPVLLTTVSSSTSSYVDYDYTVTDGYTDDLVKYDVRSCLTYQGETIYSDPSYVAIFGELELWKMPVAKVLPTEFSVESFPNPFNPSTRILYALKDAGQVKLSIIDISGREVALLKDSQESAGRYSTVWHGTNKSGSPVGTGVYFAHFVVTDAHGKVAYLRVVRLLLTK